MRPSLGGIGAQAAVVRAAEHRAGNGGDRARPGRRRSPASSRRRAAAAAASARRCAPSASAMAVMPPGVWREEIIGAGVEIHAIDGAAPLAAQAAALAEGALPDQLRLACPDRAHRRWPDFCGHDDEVALAAAREHGRGGEIEVRSEHFRAGRIVRDCVAWQPMAQLSAGSELLVPAHRAGLLVEGDDRIGHLLRRIGIGIAGGGIDQAALHIDGRRGPDAAAGGPNICTPSLFFARGLRLIDGVGLPQHRAGGWYRARRGCRGKCSRGSHWCCRGLPRPGPARR